MNEIKPLVLTSNCVRQKNPGLIGLIVERARRGGIGEAWWSHDHMIVFLAPDADSLDCPKGV